MQEKFKTIHENKNDLEKFWILDATAFDNRPLTEEELLKLKEIKRLLKISSNPNDPIANLNRFNKNLKEDLNGEYVLFSDVIKAVSILFSAKNS